MIILEFSKERKDWIWAISSFLFFVLVFICSTFPFYYGVILGIFSGFFMLIKKTRVVSDKRKKIKGIVGLTITPILLFFLTELLNVNGMSVFSYPMTVVLNILVFAMVEIIICFITKRSDIAIIATISIFLLIAMINGYVVEFRGYGFMLSDIYSVETAANMINEYTYELNERQLIALILSFFMIKFCLENVIVFSHRLLGSIISSVVLVSYVIVLSCTPFLQLFKIEPKFYYDHQNGFYVNFMGTIWVINQDRTPENYSVENVMLEYEKIKAQYDAEYTVTQTVKPVNIICIMNEALADLTVYENLNIEDPLQYIHSLTDNTISGYTYSSVYGGTTVISEYEFLTNNTAQFFGSTMSPYSTFVDEKSFSLAKQLGTYGYDSTFLHPYKSISYNRPYAYESMGFNKQYYAADMKTEFDEKYYYTDSGLYHIIEDITETQDNSFVFAVTVQNHSPYTLLDEKGINIVETGYGEPVDRYLALARESDAAFKELIEYYSNCDEPTIIVMFGDHQPKFGDEFFERIMGKSLDAMLVDSSQILYKTPFVIWANYDIEEQNNLNISINYLSTLMIEQTNIPKTVYQYYLSNVMSELPVINNNGFIDKDGTIYSKLENLPTNLQEIAKQYNLFEYNLAFDKDNIIEALNKAG